MISAEQFLAALEEKDLVPKPLIESLRKQLAKAAAPIPATVLAKKLVEKGQLTPVQAKRILEGPAPAPSAAPKADDDDYGLAPSNEVKPLAPEPPKPLAGMKKESGPAAGKRSMKDAPRPDRPSKLAAPTGDLMADLKKSPGQQKPEKPEQPAKPAPASSLLDALATGASSELDDYGVADASPQAKPADSAPAKAAETPAAKKGKQPAKGAEKKPAKLSKGTKSASPKLLAIGAGVLVVVVAIAGAAAWFLTRPTGDDDLQAAEAEFQAARYAPAIEKYNAFLTLFPAHKGAGLVRVHRGVAQLKLATAGKDYRASLGVAKQVLGEMAAQAEFSQAGSELGTMLSSIADGLARQVRKSPEVVALTNAKEALALAKRYVPREFRKPAQLAELDLSLALSARDLAGPGDLDKAVTEMRQAAGQGKFTEAYARRTALLKSYPELADQAKLREAAQAVGQAEKAAVAWTDKKQPAQSADPEGPIVASAVPFARSMKSAAPGADGQTVFAMAGGSAYALDAASGKVLWQRFVGLPSSGRSAALVPVPVGSDCVLADLPGQAVVRVERSSGKVRWRQPLGQAIEGPIAVAGNRVLAATRAGRLYYIDAESGALAGYAQLPQALAVGPVAAAEKGLVFLVGEQATLYVLSATDGKCKQVVTLGQEPGSVAAEPAVAGSLLVLATNDGLAESNLRVMAISADESLPLRFVQSEGLKGHVDASPSVAGSRVAVATDRGAVYLFDTAGAEAGKAFKLLTELPAEGVENTVRYVLLQADRLWVAGAQLARYNLAADGRFDARQTSDLDSVFLQTPAAAGGAVVCVRRCGAIPGARLAALNPADGSPFWETQVGAPLAELVGADGSLTGVTAAGVAFRVEASALKGQTLAEQTVLPKPEEIGPVAGAAALEGGLLAFAGQGSHALWIFDPKGGEKSIRRVSLADAATGGVTVFAGGALVPGRLGQVALIDAKSGDKLLEPFQPVLPGGLEYAWRPAAVAQNTLLLADGRSKLYAVQQQRDPKPHLEQAAEAQAGAVVSRVAVAGQTAYAADAAGTLAAYGLPRLERGQTWPLGRCVWGPCTVGKRVLVASAAGKLLCLDDQSKLVWQADLSSGPPAGSPIEVSGGYLLASIRGVVLKIDSNSGKQLAKLELGRPLACGPVSLGGRLFVGGSDGTLYEIKQF